MIPLLKQRVSASSWGRYLCSSDIDSAGRSFDHFHEVLIDKLEYEVQALFPAGSMPVNWCQAVLSHKIYLTALTLLPRSCSHRRYPRCIACLVPLLTWSSRRAHSRGTLQYALPRVPLKSLDKPNDVLVAQLLQECDFSGNCLFQPVRVCRHVNLAVTLLFVPLSLGAAPLATTENVACSPLIHLNDFIATNSPVS